MKKTKRAISFLLCLIMLFGTFAVGTGGFAELLNSISIKASAASATPSISADYAYNRSGSECVLTYYYSWNAYSGASYYIFYNGYKNGTINYKQKVTKTSLTSTNGNSAVSSYDNGYVSQIWVVPYDSNGTALTSNITYCEPIGGVWAFKHGINYISTDLNNPFLTTDTQKCNAETTLTTNQPTRTGYTFKGWSESKNATTATYQPGETYYVAHSNQYDIYLYAVWKANTYKVSFNANGGSCSTSSKTVTYDSTYGTLPTPTRTGYTFSGWYTSASGGTQITSSKKVTITSAQTLYAHWSANTYNITFNATNGGSCSTSSKTVTYDSTYGTLPIPTKSGYTFTGWYSSLIGGTQITSSSTVTITSDETLYAHWSDSSKPTGFISSTNNLAASQTVTLSFSDNESIAGYYWGTSSTYSYNTYTSTTSLSITKTISSAGTYYLVVKDGAGNVSDSVSITFHLTTLNANNGSVTPVAILTQNGYSFALPTAERDGYTFLGWATSSTATSAQYQPGASFNLNDNMVLYAVWEKTAYTAKFIVDGQTVSSMTCYYGDTINKPADPSKSGYTFTGWAPEVPATMPEQNLTFYAQWSKDNSFEKSNRFWFSNSTPHFVTSWSGNKKYMTQSDINKLFAYIRNYDKNYLTTISNVQDYINSSWSGSCYGMAATAILDYHNKIAFNENFDKNAPTLFNVKSPSTSPAIMSAINYYMVSQRIGFIRDAALTYSSNYANWSAGLKKFVSVMQNNEPIHFCYAWNTSDGRTAGHAIVALNCNKKSDGSFQITAYDNRFPNDDVFINISSDYQRLIVKTPYGNEDAFLIEFLPNMNVFDKIDIDGPDNDLNIVYSSYSYDNANSYINVVADGDVTVTNKVGETITISNGEISGTMDILSTHIIVNDTIDGEPAPVTFVFEVNESNTFTIESTSDSIDASVTTNSMYASAFAESADSLVFGNNEGVYVISDGTNYKTVLSSKDSSYDTVVVKGNSDKDVSLTYSGSNILIGGVTNSSEEITIFTQNADMDNYSVQEGYEDIQITTDETNNIDIKGSSNNDGNYDISVGKKEIDEPEYTAVFISDGKTISEKKYKEGEIIQKPANPSKNGYSFKTWTPLVPAKMPAKDMTFTAVFEKNNPTASAKLNAKTSTTVDYRSKVNITATASGVPDGYFLAIYSGNTLLEKGTKDKVTYTPKDNNKPAELKSDTTYTVKVIDSKNAVQKDSSGKDLTANVEIKVKQGFFDKLIAFFKGLFGLLPTVEIKP
ncbi:MAG: InlB B-repeat-containing protein [Clostridia bacterium]|nr:InlB B-repeat-containing protein [Clostridia bacterium]